MSATPSLEEVVVDTPSLPRKLEKSIIANAAKSDKKCSYVIGVDEAGRGPLAGPVVAAAFCFRIPNNPTPASLQHGVTDSKQVTEHIREHIYYNNIRDNPDVLYSVSVVSNKVIDKINILQATFAAMTESATAVMNRVKTEIDPSAKFTLLIDGNKVPPQLTGLGQFVIKGDSIEFVIAAASICAKVERDAIMRDIDDEFPMYGFKQHKGYGTGSHMAAIRQHGACRHHRMTFAPLKTMGNKRKSASSSVPVKAASSAVGDGGREERLKRRTALRELAN